MAAAAGFINPMAAADGRITGRVRAGAWQCRAQGHPPAAGPGESRGVAVPIDFKILTTVFTTVFIAELGDKTQLATLLFAADKEVSKLTVFVGASLALIATSALGVLAGGWLAQHVSPKLLHVVAGIAFIAIGIWTLVKS
jgi:putative Ca2+/H+ antiporter (TMEM165/GDT1 family)